MLDCPVLPVVPMISYCFTIVPSETLISPRCVYIYLTVLSHVITIKFPFNLVYPVAVTVPLNNAFTSIPDCALYAVLGKNLTIEVSTLFTQYPYLCATPLSTGSIHFIVDMSPSSNASIAILRSSLAAFTAC